MKRSEMIAIKEKSHKEASIRLYGFDDDDDDDYFKQHAANLKRHNLGQFSFQTIIFMMLVEFACAILQENSNKKNHGL